MRRFLPLSFTLVPCATLLLSTLAPLPAAARPPWESIPSWGDLDRDERARVERLAQARQGYGPCAGTTIAACFESGKRMGWRLGRLLIYLVQGGAGDDDVERIIQQRRDSYDAKPREIDTTGSPVLGPEKAVVTVVEFADFECPMCAAVTGTLKEAVLSSGGKARLVFKQFPLKGHRTSLQAAIASLAARRHGKFWEMSELLFRHLDEHEPRHLDEYAKRLGIPLDPFRAAMKDPEILRAVEKDKDLGLRLGVRATPTLFVNGREFKPLRDKFYLADRIEEEVDRIEGRR